MAVDIEKVKRNIQRMIEMDAPEEDIDEYLSSEGVTIEDLQARRGPAEPHGIDHGLGHAALTGAVQGVTANYGDEIAGGMAGLIDAFRGNVLGHEGRDFSSGYRRVRDRARADEKVSTEEHPVAYYGGQIGGILGAAPLLPSVRMAQAGYKLLPRAGAGVAEGAAFGGLSGAGAGTNTKERTAGAGQGAALGAGFGLAGEALGSAASYGYQGAKNFINRGVAAPTGRSAQAVRNVGHLMSADDLSHAGSRRIAQAGPEGMLADAGPTARGALDTAIQRAGPAADLANRRIGNRVSRESRRVTDTLDNTLGAPEGVTAARTRIREGSRTARSDAYGDAYAGRIDYNEPAARRMLETIRERVPPAAIREANRLMRAEGENRFLQIAWRQEGDNLVFEQAPNIRQIDYITRGLNSIAKKEDGKGSLGGTTQLGRAYSNLSRDIRNTARVIVPDYDTALRTAQDPIRRSSAVELGSKAIKSNMPRDEFAEAIEGMSAAELRHVASGMRSEIDEVTARATKTAGKADDMSAREAIAGLRKMSSRNVREKVAMVVGPAQARRMFRELDRIARSFELRADVATGSRTYGRMAMDKRMERTGQNNVNSFGEFFMNIVRKLKGKSGMAQQEADDTLWREVTDLLTDRRVSPRVIQSAIRELRRRDEITEHQARTIAAAAGALKMIPAGEFGTYGQ